MWNVFSTYELRARLVPAVLVLAPPLASLHACGLLEDITILDGTLGVAALYLLAQVIAKWGRELQPRLFGAWGGAPSTTVVRWDNSVLSQHQKKNISLSAQSILGQALPTAEEETNDSESADRRREEVFKEVRNYLYERESKGLWRSHLAEYGLVRNLLGAAWIAGGIAVLCAAFCLYRWYQTSRAPTLAVGAMSLGYGLTFIIGRYSFLLSFAEQLGQRYAESAWLSFLNSTRAQMERGR